MASESLVLDPTSEDASNTQVSLEDTANGITVISQEYPPPERERQLATSADTFGDPYVQGRYRNRVITLRVRCFGTESVMRARVADLTKKAGKLAQYGGTLKRTLNNSDVVIFDVLDADIDVPADWQFLHRNSVEVTLTLLAKPAGRGAEVSFDAVSETTLPALIFSVTGVKGDLPGLGRLVITEQDAEDQQFVQAGWECRNYPGASAGTSTAHLFYEAETRLPLNGATALALAGASGGTVINQGTLTTSYAAMLSLASSGTVYPTHVGDFSVWARVYQGTANLGTVSCALEWALADGRRVTRNPAAELDPLHEGQFLHVNLGQVHLPAATAGSQQWQGRIVAKSTDYPGADSDSFAVDCVYLFPVTEGYFEARGVPVFSAPTSFNAYDKFNQTAGALTGKVLPVGGTWTFLTGDADDFNVNGSGRVTRTATADGSARLVAAGTATMTTCAVAADVKMSAVDAAADTQCGVFARYVDATKWLALVVTAEDTLYDVTVRLLNTSATTLLTFTSGVRVGEYVRLKLYVDAAGQVLVEASDTNGSRIVRHVLQNASLATGGTHASGRFGVIDQHSTSPTAMTRTYDNFEVWTPETDAAMFASQSLEVAHNRAERETASGGVYGRVRSFVGEYVSVPAENVGGTVRYIVKGSRVNPDEGADAGIDVLGAQLHYTPLYLNIPE